MAPMYPIVSRTRRLWVLGAVALPFLALLLWSGLLIHVRVFDLQVRLPGIPPGDAFGIFNVAETIRSMGGEATVARSERGWTEITLKFPLQGAP